MHPLLTLEDKTEIVYSDADSDGHIKVYCERPDAKACFNHATYMIPESKWQDITGFSNHEIQYLQNIIESNISK